MSDPCRLLPRSLVDVSGDGFVATGIEPWLDVADIDWPALAGSFIELTYRASLLDEPARPVFRFGLAHGGAVERIAAAPVVGAAIWIGRVPARTIGLAVSPTNRPGRFGFAIERIRRRSWLSLLAQGVRHRPRQTRSSILTRLIGWTPESDNNLAWAVGAVDFAAYRRWAASRTRPFDPNGLDAPRHDWSRAADVLLVVRGANDAPALARTLESLRAQAFPNWRALVVDEPPHGAVGGEKRIEVGDVSGTLGRLEALADDVLVGVITAGDTLPAYACAALSEQRNRYPHDCIVYGDEISAGEPLFKRDSFCHLMTGIGRAVFVTGVASWTANERRDFACEGALPVRLVASACPRPLRRVLLDTPRAAAPVASEPRTPPPLSTRVAIVILTRDQPALLERAVASVRASSPPNLVRLVVVDNGEPDGPAKELLDTLGRTPDVLVLRRRDAFNFSRFCNEAVAACDEELLVFLNDDTQVLSGDWLERLAALAFDPAVGAVGAKLTFPDGRLQHVGVLVGMGGSAGHLGSMAPGDDPGWVGRNTMAHDISAVTGACLAVTRAKFEAVGGFDAEHLPVELSDIDLCLKLNARGWQTMIDPAVHLLHEESASRGGATFRRLDVYARQRQVFVERWRHVLRDDPAFHPGLSLYSLRAALG